MDDELATKESTCFFLLVVVIIIAGELSNKDYLETIVYHTID